MKPNIEISTLNGPVLLAPDSVTGVYVRQFLGKVGIEPCETVAKTRGGISAVSRIIGDEPATVIMVPSPVLGKGQVNLVGRVVGNGGVVLGWCGFENGLFPKDTQDRWILKCMLEQKGALTSPRLDLLVEVLRLLPIVGDTLNGKPVIRVKGPPSDLRVRLVQTLSSVGFVVADKRIKSQIGLEFDTIGEVSLFLGRDGRLQVQDPMVTIGALTLLSTSSISQDGENERAIEPMQKEVDLIVRPPCRLLSETASKRVISAFGIDTANERLCRSPSEAVRFAKALHGPAVLKLVKPGLEDKRNIGAILPGIQGPSAVRRGVQSLESLSSSLGGPPSLGIMVSEQVEGEVTAHLTMGDDPQLGRMIFIRLADGAGHEANGVVSVPATRAEIYRLFLRLSFELPIGENAPFLDVIVRLSALCHQLGGRINRADVELIVTAQTTLVFDALIGIA